MCDFRIPHTYCKSSPPVVKFEYLNSPVVHTAQNINDRKPEPNFEALKFHLNIPL